MVGSQPGPLLQFSLWASASAARSKSYLVSGSTSASAGYQLPSASTGPHVTFGRTGTRTTVGLPGTGLSYTHVEKSRDNAFSAAPASETPAAEVPKGKAWRGWLWIAVRVRLSASVMYLLGA
jgi:hypothetical protein